MSDISLNTNKIDADKNEEVLATMDDDEPVVAGAKVMCSNQTGQIAQMIIKIPSNDTRNGNMALKDTDTSFFPMTFGWCKLKNKRCVPLIEQNRWKCCDFKNLIAGRPGVTMDSFMICVNGGGIISIVENGQIAACNFSYGQKLKTEEIEKLIKHFFVKVVWTCQDDIDNAEYIAKCMKEAGMDTRMSIEFFLLTCCAESGRGAKLEEVGGNGLGFIQLTSLSEEQWQNLAEQGNKWREACGKDAIVWKNIPPLQSEIEAAVIDRDELAWEGAIFYWCNVEMVDNKIPINDYVAGYEKGNSGTYDQAGLYFATQCFVNGGETGNPTSKIREGNINDYVIIENPSPETYDYQFKEVRGKPGVKPWKAPNGTVERARVYMEYYDEKEPIWNFSQDILNNWNTISS